MDPSTLTTIRYEAADGVATITLDRPDAYDAFTTAMCEEMAAVWASVREDDAVRAVVLTAAGDKAFCTGIDRTEVPAEGGSSTASTRSLQKVDRRALAAAETVAEVEPGRS